VSVEQVGRTEGDIVGVLHTDAELASHLDFGSQGAVGVDLGLAVFTPLAEHVGSDEAQQLGSGRPLVDGHEVDDVESGDRLGAQGAGEGRPIRAFVDELVRRDGDDQDVAVLAGLLEMPDVADVQQVEHAVAVDDAFALLFESGHFLGQAGKAQDLAGGSHDVTPPPLTVTRRSRPQPVSPGERCHHPTYVPSRASGP